MTGVQTCALPISLADHDQSDYVGIGEKMRAIGAVDEEIAALEERWLELSELLES